MKPLTPIEMRETAKLLDAAEGIPLRSEVRALIGACRRVCEAYGAVAKQRDDAIELAEMRLELATKAAQDLRRMQPAEGGALDLLHRCTAGLGRGRGRCPFGATARYLKPVVGAHGHSGYWLQRCDNHPLFGATKVVPIDQEVSGAAD
jgi:hypothetical protein